MDINGKSTAAESLPTGKIYMDSDKVPTLNIPPTAAIPFNEIADRLVALEKENEKLKEMLVVAMSLAGELSFQYEPKRLNALEKYMKDMGLPIPCEVKFGEDKVTVERIQEEGE
jgi:hypothetical protein